MADPKCADCGHNLWLHAEMDFNGDRCCECERFKAMDAETSGEGTE